MVVVVPGVHVATLHSSPWQGPSGRSVPKPPSDGPLSGFPPCAAPVPPVVGMPPALTLGLPPRSIGLPVPAGEQADNAPPAHTETPTTMERHKAALIHLFMATPALGKDAYPRRAQCALFGGELSKFRNQIKVKPQQS